MTKADATSRFACVLHSTARLNPVLLCRDQQTCMNVLIYMTEIYAGEPSVCVYITVNDRREHKPRAQC